MNGHDEDVRVPNERLGARRLCGDGGLGEETASWPPTTGREGRAFRGRRPSVARPSRWLLLAAVLIVQLVPAVARAEPRGLCRRACRAGIAACAAGQKPMKHRKAR